VDKGGQRRELSRANYWLASSVPLVTLGILVVLDRWGLSGVMGRNLSDLLTVGIAAVLVLAYTLFIVRVMYPRYLEMGALLKAVEAQRDRMKLLQEGMTAIASNRDVESILLRVVELSREITGAAYGALAVLNPDESIARFVTSGLKADQIQKIGSLPRGRGLLGEVIRTKKPLRVDDITQHPASVGWPPHHPEMRSFLGVPMLFQNEVVGHLYLTNKEGGPFTEADEELVNMLATQAAVLISNARLNRELEALAVLQERQRIGMDLHDGTIQAIYAVMLGIDGLLDKIPEELSDIRDQLDAFGDRLSRITQDIRHYIFDLKPDHLDLRQGIGEIAAELAMTHQIRIHTTDLDYRELSRRQVESLLAWVREALTNVNRHAHATQVEVTWRRSGPTYQLTVEDNGVGFDPAVPPGPGHYGLRNLRKRASELGGSVVIQSRPGQGTRVELTAPFRFEFERPAEDEEGEEGEDARILSSD
jgi:signal transduction histidine kinase